VQLSVDERDELRISVRRLLEQASSSEAVRARLDDPVGFDAELWGQMVELGWLAIHVPEEHGGAGAGYAELAIVLHELGRQITPSPFLATAVLGAGALVAAENEALRAELLPALVAGEQRASVAVTNEHGSCDVSQLSVLWEREGGGVRLRGTASFAPDVVGADALFVAARAAHGEVALVAVEPTAPGVAIDPMAMIDRTRRLARVTFDDVVVAEGQLLCDPGPRSQSVVERLVSLGAIVVACDATGVAERVMERTAEYAKERVQFGKPIGSFQAVKHHCANMLVAVEGSRAAVRDAIDALDDPGSDLPFAAAVASSYVGPAASGVCGLSVQVHGGIGFTWEHDAHLCLKRAKLDEAWFGTPAWHRRHLADTVFPAGTPR
jgi:alkylation response protein AidB-like acyl-CoA dehydrogenase